MEKKQDCKTAQGKLTVSVSAVLSVFAFYDHEANKYKCPSVLLYICDVMYGFNK